ncbi:zinc finger protein 407 isoform X2 [Hemiscyllium ocellatum]|uniref:zinc finger protein 407 isoform X2 n=1 Tax=Hemiscyllium ocellatum TaxID=170820 RepID=UPI0029672C38|nr:zinc finger protein 407 isoform X2 [Hemiscyllium ocellatum]
MDVSEESIDSECNLFELPANGKKIGKTRAKSALRQNTRTGLIRRCRRKANPQPEIAKDLNASATLEGKVTHGRPKGGKTPCGEVPPAKKQKLDTLEQTQDSGRIETAKGSALTCEGEPASSKTKHVENDIVTDNVQFEGQTGDYQHRSKKIKVEATSLSPSYKHIWKNDTSLKTNVNQCHFNENCFVCNICNVTSPSKESYKKHISSVRHKKQAISTCQDTITKEGFNCRLCGHLLPSRYDLDKHIKENHSKRSKAHICPQCKFKAESAVLLQAHLKHKHFQEEKLSCDLCGYQCYDENLLKTHYRGKTHLRRKNLAARGGYIHLLSKKDLSGECSAKDKVRNAKLLNTRPGNLRKTRNRCFVQKDAKQSTECLDKSTRIGNNLCVEEGNSNKMPMANDQIELNDCHAGKASPRRTLRSIKEPSNLLQEHGVNQRLRCSGNGNVSLRLCSARCKVNSEHSQSTRSRLSKEEVANRKSPRKLQRRASLSTKNNSRRQGQFPHKREVFPEAQQKSGSVAGSKNGSVKETSKLISQESNQLEGKPQNQSKSTDMTLTDANLEDENAFKKSCSSDNQDGASTPSEVPNSLALVENNIESTSGDQNFESPSANPTNTKASKVENTESKLSPADRKALRTCSYCGHLFQNRKGLEVHIKRRHTKEMVFHCQPCGYACVTKGDFEKHCQSNRHQLNFSKIDCWLCTFVTSDEETLKDHMNQKHKIVAYCRHCKVHFVSEDDLVDHVDTEQHARNMFPQQKETTTEQTEKLQPRELELNKTSSSDTNEESTVQKANPLIDPQRSSITRVVAGNILKRSTHSRPQLQCKHCFYKARSASVLLKHIRLRHAQEYRFYCKVCSLYTISKEAMEKHIKRTRHIMNAKKQSLGPSVEECIEEVSVGVCDIQKTMKTPEALGNVNTEIDKGYVQVLEPSKPKEEFVVTWEIPESDTGNVEDAQKSSDLQSTGSVKRGRPKGNISRTCLYCGLLASSVTNLNIHIRRKHSHQYSYFCKTCNYYTVTKGDMDRHCNTKKHKNQVDVSKTELCRKIAISPDKDLPQVIVNDVASVSMAEDVQNSGKGLKSETPDVKNQSGKTENCTRVNLESFPSTQVQQKVENQNEIVVVLDVESNDMGQNGSSSNSKPRKENHTTTCVYCGFMAYSLATLEMHVKRKHTKDFDYYCMACAYYAVTRREMMRHAITEKHKLKSQSYLKLNPNKGCDSSTVLTVAPENEHQKEGNEHQMDEGSWNEEGGISKASRDAIQKSVSSIIETEKAVEDSEVVSAAKETAAVSKMAENQVKSLQDEVAEEEENTQTLSAVCYSEISSETYSGILEANTAHSNAPLDTESHAAELKSVSLESAVLETIQNQISQSPSEQDSSSFYKDIVTSQKTNVKNDDIDLHVEASHTEEDDFQQLSEAGDSGEDEQNVKPAEVAKEISSSLDSSPNEMVDPGQNHPDNCDIEEEENMEEGLLASAKDVEGSSVQDGCHLQPGKNSEHTHVNRVQQIDSNDQNIEAVSEEMSVQGDINPPHDFGGSENLLDDQNKREADLKEKAGDMKSANENSQELEITESTGDNLKLDLQGSKPFRCTLCNFATAQLGDARNHVKRHLGVREYKCHICGWAFVMKKHLSTHLLGKHGIGTPKERKFVCEICDRTFTEKWALTNHKKLHMGQKPFKCTWLTCHYSFLTASAMRDHFRTHTGEKSFLCDLCGFAGGTRHALTKHRRQHTGEKPFKCDQCNFASTTQSHLTRHRRVHTGEKPYKCPWCDYRSNCAENIRKHILHTGKHEGVQMYNCPKCDYGTNIPLEFRNHLKELHPDIENPDLAYLHAGIVSKAYECRLKGQGAQFVETAVPVNLPRVVSTEITGDSLGGCIEQQESADSIGQVFIIQGYQVGCGEEISIDTSVEATAAATLQTLAMVGQMTQVAKVMHITEDGQIIDTTQNTTHVSNMVPEQTVTQQPISGATQEAAGKELTEQGSATEAAVAIETLTDSNQVERVVTQEDEAKPTSERPTALVALLCAVTEVGTVEARSAEQEGSESTQEGSYSVNSAIENVISTQKESVHEGTETFHEDQTVQETTEAEGTVSNIGQQISVTTTQEGSQVAFSDVVQEVLQFTMCDMRTTSHIVKDGVTRVIVAKEGTTHVVEGASQIIVQEGEEQTIATNGHPMRLVDSSGEISQIIITEEVLQAMVQETTGHLSEEATHVIVTEVPHSVVNGDHSRAVTEVYPQRVMELVNEDISSSQSVASVALAECYTEDRSEVVMIELPAKEEQEMEIDGIQEA